MSESRRHDNRPINVYVVTDGKAGHENQIRGLVERLGARASLRTHRVPVRKSFWRLARVLGRAASAEMPDPDLVLCAGRRTHRPALAIKRRRGGVLVVCMRPYVGQRHFDLCLIPAHDEPERAPNVETTTGALVNVHPSSCHDQSRGVILIGGPSSHYGIHTDALIDQIATIVDATPGVRWDLATSRRTTKHATERLLRMRGDRLTVWRADETPPGWVRDRLASCGTSWITEDSVSMLCESVTAGCATGLLPMPRRNPDGRVARGVDDLRARGLVTTYERWLETGELRPPTEPLDEPDRCARLILRRFFPDRGDAS